MRVRPQCITKAQTLTHASAVPLEPIHSRSSGSNYDTIAKVRAPQDQIYDDTVPEQPIYDDTVPVQPIYDDTVREASMYDDTIALSQA